MIYFIIGGKHVKIGCSNNPEQRLRELQTGNPHKLRIALTMPGDYQTEAALHEIYKKKRRQGEWFTYTDKLKASVEHFQKTKTIPKTPKEFQEGGLKKMTLDRARRKSLRGDTSLKNRIASVR